MIESREMPETFGEVLERYISGVSRVTPQADIPPARRHLLGTYDDVVAAKYPQFDGRQRLLQLLTDIGNCGVWSPKDLKTILTSILLPSYRDFTYDLIERVVTTPEGHHVSLTPRQADIFLPLILCPEVSLPASVFFSKIDWPLNSKPAFLAPVVRQIREKIHDQFLYRRYGQIRYRYINSPGYGYYILKVDTPTDNQRR